MYNKLVERNFNAMAVKYQLHFPVQAPQRWIPYAAIDVYGDPEEHAAGEKDLYSAAEETLTGTIFEIYGDRIVVTRYDAGGAHVLGHKGQADPYKGGIDAGLIPEASFSSETLSSQVIRRYDRGP